MNDLFSSSFSGGRDQSPPDSHTVEMAASGGQSLDTFFRDVDAIKDQFQGLESLCSQLRTAHEQSKSLHNAKTVKELRSRMESLVSTALKTAKQIKTGLEDLDRSNVENRALPGCGPGSSSDRTRTSIVHGLRKKLHGMMVDFNELRQKMGSEYRDTVRRRYYTVTGESPEEGILDRLIETGESESFLEKAIQQQGRGQVMDTIIEIQERHDAVREIERSLKELHQVFKDMAVLVESQGEQLDDIESQVERANSYVRGAAGQLAIARKLQKNTRKWACIGIVLLLIIVLIVVLSLRPWS